MQQSFLPRSGLGIKPGVSNPRFCRLLSCPDGTQENLAFYQRGLLLPREFFLIDKEITVPFCKYRSYEINYDIQGNPGTPVIVFINGLTQRIQHWAVYMKYLVPQGYRVLTYDLLGQGKSAKPVLDVNFEENAEVLKTLLDHLSIEKAYITGISFGGVIVLHFGIRYPERVKGLVPMSTFSEMDAQTAQIGCNLYEGMTRVGFEYMVRLLIPLNFSANWIAKNEPQLAAMQRTSAATNDLYAIQNLMESLRNFKGFTAELKKINAPTLILNGEFDAFTPRSCHEILRKNIVHSRLMLMQKVYHAFTLEIPEITARVLLHFVKEVESGQWQGDQTVWIASDDPKSEVVAFPCEGDHTRAIPLIKK